jgi:hypothetical protein
MIGQSGVPSMVGMRSSSRAPMAFETRRRRMIDTFPCPLSSWAM